MSRPSSPPRKYAVWTLTELKLLERHFHSMTWGELQQRYFPKRTVSAVKRMAGKLGLTKYSAQREYGQAPWTGEELRFVAMHFPALKAPEIQRRYLPHRSPIAIRAAAKKLGLRAFETHIWTEEDEALLRHYYPQGGPELVQQYLPERTVEAIRARACAQGLRHVRRGDGQKWDNWSEEELARLKQHRHLSADELAKLFPHRPRSAVINKRHKLGWSQVTKWSQDELKRLREHLDASLDELRLLFPNRPRQGILIRRQRLRRELKGEAPRSS